MVTNVDVDFPRWSQTPDLTTGWQLINAHTVGGFDNATYRMQIPEGWLYRYGNGTLVFVPA